MAPAGPAGGDLLPRSTKAFLVYPRLADPLTVVCPWFFEAVSAIGAFGLKLPGMLQSSPACAARARG